LPQNSKPTTINVLEERLCSSNKACHGTVEGPIRIDERVGPSKVMLTEKQYLFYNSGKRVFLVVGTMESALLYESCLHHSCPWVNNEL
jgi:hypothetical protein